MSTPPGKVYKTIIIDLIKKRMLEKIDALFQLGIASQDKYSEKNRITLNSILNKDQSLDEDLNLIKQRMIKAINDLDLTQYDINEESGYTEGVLACIRTLKELGIVIEKWRFGEKNIQDVLISGADKLKSDLEKVLQKERFAYLEKLQNQDIEYQDIPEHYRESESFINELVERECELKNGDISDDFNLIHPFHLLDENFSSRSRLVQNQILKLLATMPRYTMQQLAKPRDHLQSIMEEYDLSLNKSLCLYTVQHDTQALEFLPAKFKRDERILEAALRANAAQLQFVPEDMKQKFIDQLGAENLLRSNILAYKYFPKNDINTQAIHSFFSKVEHIVVNTSQGDAELQDVSLVYGNKEKRRGKTAFVGFKYSPTASSLKDADSKAILTELDELFLAIKTANNHKELHLALAAHSNTGTGSKKHIGHSHFEDIAELCKRHVEIKHINLLTCSAAGSQTAPEDEQKMISDLRKKEQGIKKYLFEKKPPIQSEEKFRAFCIDQCEKYKVDGIYFLIENKNSTPKYSLQFMKLVNKELLSKTMAIPVNKEKFIQRFEVQNKGKLTALSLTQLIELRSTTSEQHRFDPNHPKFEKDKKRFPFLAKFEIQEQDLKESKMKSLAESLRDKKISQEISIQAYPDFMEVDTETNYLRAVKGLTFHLNKYKESLYATGQSGVDRIKVLTQQKDKIEEIVESEPKSSVAKKLKVTLKPDPAAPIVLPPQHKSPELLALEQAVSKQLSDFIKSIKPTNEATDGLPGEKARIIGEFLKSLDNATTVEEYCNAITDFMKSPEYRTINPVRKADYQVLGWMGAGRSLIDDLHHAAVQYVESQLADRQPTLM